MCSSWLLGLVSLPIHSFETTTCDCGDEAPVTPREHHVSERSRPERALAVERERHAPSPKSDSV